MSEFDIEVKLKPFRFPNFIFIDCRANDDKNTLKMPVAEFTDEQALAYWDTMKERWLEHVVMKRNTWRN